MTFHTTIGDFWIDHFDMSEPAMTMIGTNAPINSPRATEHFLALTKGRSGLGEITDIHTFPTKVVLTFSEVVTTEATAKKLTESFFQRLTTSLEDFDQVDLELWKVAAQPRDFSQALAVASDGDPNDHDS